MTLCKKILQIATPLILATVMTTNTQAQARENSVPDLIRKTPYDFMTEHTLDNWYHNRRQIILNYGICEEGKNIFLNKKGEHLGEVERIVYDEKNDSTQTIERARRINQQRLDVWREGFRRQGNRVAIHPQGGLGYPFAFSCRDHNKEFYQRGVNAYFGLLEDKLIQQGWRGYQIDEPISIREAFRLVEENFSQLSQKTKNMLRGQMVAESGGDRYARTNSSLGLMQIMPANLREMCDISEEDFLNELAQIHCAYQFVSHHEPRIRRAVDYRFSHSSQEDQETLLADLLMRGFHSGPEHQINMIMPRGIDACNKSPREQFIRDRPESASCYLALTDYEPEKIGFLLSFHNLGAEHRGFARILRASLLYPLNARLGYELLEEKAEVLGITVH